MGRDAADRHKWGFRIDRLLEEHGDQLGKWEEQFLQDLLISLDDGQGLSDQQMRKIRDIEVQRGIPLERP